MCGLFGMAGRMNPEQRQTVLRALAVANASRGDHSTGLAAISRKRNTVSIWKQPVKPREAVNSKGFNSICKAAANVFIGHTRWATTGKVNKANAHPFHIGSTVGAHNGVVTTWKLRERLGYDYKNDPYDVDSQYLVALLDRDNALGEISGNAAMAFSRMSNAEDVALIRVNNPLSIAAIGMTGKKKTLHGHSVVWSSTEDDLIDSLALAGITDYTLGDFRNFKRWNISLDDNSYVTWIGEQDAPATVTTGAVSGGCGFRGSNHTAGWGVGDSDYGTGYGSGDAYRWEGGKKVYTYPHRGTGKSSQSTGGDLSKAVVYPPPAKTQPISIEEQADDVQAGDAELPIEMRGRTPSQQRDIDQLKEIGYSDDEIMRGYLGDIAD